LKRSDRIRPVKEIVDSRERDAGRRLAEARTRVEEQEKQLQQLQRYRDEYLAGGTPAVGTTDTVRLVNLNAFLGRISDAIREQQARIAEARRELEALLEAWRGVKLESTALGRAVERFEADERRADDRQEQREQDKLAAQRPLRPPT
jgi:flagellar FliJ protein